MCIFEISYLQGSRWKFNFPVNLGIVEIINPGPSVKGYFCTSFISPWIYILLTERPLCWQFTNLSMRNTERVWAKPVTIDKLQENSPRPPLQVGYSNSVAMRKPEKNVQIPLLLDTNCLFFFFLKHVGEFQYF